MTFDLRSQLSEQAYSACVAEFAEHEGRPMNEDERSVTQRASALAVEWASKQPVESFLAYESEWVYHLRRSIGSKDKRRQRRLSKREERQRVRECRSYVEDHWDDVDGYGFIFALVSAVIWHLIVILIVRWLLKRFFASPSLALTVCGEEW